MLSARILMEDVPNARRTRERTRECLLSINLFLKTIRTLERWKAFFCFRDAPCTRAETRACCRLCSRLGPLTNDTDDISGRELRIALTLFVLLLERGPKRAQVSCVRKHDERRRKNGTLPATISHFRGTPRTKQPYPLRSLVSIFLTATRSRSRTCFLFCKFASFQGHGECVSRHVGDGQTLRVASERPARAM